MAGIRVACNRLRNPLGENVAPPRSLGTALGGRWPLSGSPIGRWRSGESNRTGRRQKDDAAQLARWRIRGNGIGGDGRPFIRAADANTPATWRNSETKRAYSLLDYDQEELDAAYTQALWAPNQAELDRRNAQKSARAVARLGPARRLAYGPTEAEKLDLYTTKAPNAPINVYVHGAWRAGDAAYAAYQSEMFVDSGAHFIALDFNNVLETKGNLMTMAQQVRRGVAWVYRNAGSFGGDPNRLYVSGHSSGGHLAAVVLTTDWQKDFGLPIDTVKGGLCASGMYDLYPVSLSARRSYVNFSVAIVEALSPQRHLDTLVAPVIVSHGTWRRRSFNARTENLLRQ